MRSKANYTLTARDPNCFSRDHGAWKLDGNGELGIGNWELETGNLELVGIGNGEWGKCKNH